MDGTRIFSSGRYRRSSSTIVMARQMKQLIIPIILIALGVVLRLSPHPANFSPIAAIALFSGVYLEKKYVFFVPLLAMIFSDMELGFYAGSVVVYACFSLSAGIGLWIRNHKHVTTIIGGTLLSSVLFYLITNFNWWYADALYPKTMAGLFQSYINALPFFRNTLLGDMTYTGIFFIGYEVIRRISFAPKTLPHHTK